MMNAHQKSIVQEAILAACRAEDVNIRPTTALDIANGLDDHGMTLVRQEEREELRMIAANYEAGEDDDSSGGYDVH
jgi:hypothetical protein